MSSDTKQYPPSDTKLEKLRRSGVVPHSRFVDVAGIIAGLLLGLVVLRSNGIVALRGFAEGSWSGDFSAPLTDKPVLEVLGVTSGLFLFAYVLVRFAFGIISTKGLFTFGAVRFSPGKIFSWKQNVLPQRFSLFSILLFVTVLTAWGVLSWLFGLYFFREFSDSGSMVANRDYDPDAAIEGILVFGLENVIGWVLGAAAILGLGAATIGYLVATLEFRRRHAMSRAELEAEYRESEVAPQLRQARKSIAEE